MSPADLTLAALFGCLTWTAFVMLVAHREPVPDLAPDRDADAQG